MNLDMWFKDDISNMLDGIIIAVKYSGSNQPPEWQAGFIAGLVAVSASFGITKHLTGECTVTHMEGPYRLDDGGSTVDGTLRLVRAR